MPCFGKENLALVVLWVTGKYSPLFLAGSRKGSSWPVIVSIVSLRHARVVEIKMIARVEKTASGVGFHWHQLYGRRMGFVVAVSTAAEPGKALVMSELKCKAFAL